MAGKSSQAKGRRGEIELARVLQDCGLPVKAGDPANHGRTADVIGLPDIHCEVKRHERLNVWEALEQAERDSKRFGGMPTLFFRRNRSPWFVCMRLTDWVALYKAFFR